MVIAMHIFRLLLLLWLSTQLVPLGLLWLHFHFIESRREPKQKLANRLPYLVKG